MDSITYQSLDGVELAKLLWSGQVSALELILCAIDLADSKGRLYNAIVYPKYEEALEIAKAGNLRGPFGAVPFLLKDSGLASTRFPTSMGSRMFANQRSTVESTLNNRFIDAGLLSFARTTVPEFNMAPTTEAIQNGGPTLNPWDPSRSSGGSSGGAAVAVASGIVPIAHASDGGGSIRIPASCCGLFGLKPSRGLVPCGPMRGEGWGGLAADGVLTRSVRDTANVLDAIAGMERGAPYAAPALPQSFHGCLNQNFERPQRLAVWTEAWDDIPVAPECIDAVFHAAKLLRSLGHEVIQTPPPALKFSAFVDAIIDVMASNVAVTVNGFLRHNPKCDPQRELEPAIYDAYCRGSRLSAEAYALAINRFHSLSRIMETYIKYFDFILTPTLSQLPLPIGFLSTSDDFRTFREKAARYTVFLALFNASGQPAASLPLYWTDGGLPVGIQIVSHFGREDQILKISSQLETLSPWKDRRPAQGLNNSVSIN